MRHHFHFQEKEIFKSKKRDEVYKIFKKAGLGGHARFWGGDDEENTTTTTETPKFYATPELPEATQARTKLSSTIQGWGPENNYGLVNANWDDIYNNAARKLQEYYFGSAMGGGGAMGAINADLSRRNVSDSPASSILKGRMGVEQANKIGDLRSSIDQSKAQAAETSRINWLSSMSNLAGMKPAGTWGGTTTQTSPDNSMDNLITSLGYGAGQLAGNKLFNTATASTSSWLGNMFQGLGGSTGTTQSSLTNDLTNPYGDNYNTLWKRG